MQSLIEAAIERESKKRLAKHSRDWYYKHKYRKLFTKRTGKRSRSGSAGVPPAWEYHSHFDPRYCLNHSKFLASGIWRSLQAGAYSPCPSLRISIPKATGGSRLIDSFSIPDAAIAKIFLDNIRKRNAKIFSDSSYAYQLNKTPLDAIIRLKASLQSEINFVSQYDFSKFFDSIDHDYVQGILGGDGPFLTTAMERQVISAVLTHDFEDVSGEGGTRDRGTPQGNSISLFLANVAAHPLDQELSQLSGTFARFADDSVVVNTSYEDALRTADAFHRFSRSSGININIDKSSGIRMFSDSPMEMAHIVEFEFLGYKFKKSGLYLGDRAISAIKRRCARIIFNHLILHIRRMESIRKNRLGIGFRDWDLVTCINELRFFIYGGRSQHVMDTYLEQGSGIQNISGAVSYFALVEDSSIFRELDGWLAYAIERAYNKRIKLIATINGKAVRKIRRSKLVSGSWYKFPSLPNETRLPSFFTAWRAARKSWSRHGLGGIDPQGLGYTYL